MWTTGKPQGKNGGVKKWHTGGWKSGKGDRRIGDRQQGQRQRLARWRLGKDGSPPETLASSSERQGLASRICEALESGKGIDAAFGMIVRESSTISAICDLRSDYRWAAVRNNCTFRKPDLVGMLDRQDEVRKALDEAEAAGGRHAGGMGRLRERYRAAIMGEALVIACMKGDEEQAGRLLGMGADANATGLMGERPLTAAAGGGFNAGVIRMLLEHGAGINGDRESAMEIARRCRHEGNVRALGERK
jgi:hypothetical protein